MDDLGKMIKGLSPNQKGLVRDFVEALAREKEPAPDSKKKSSEVYLEGDAQLKNDPIFQKYVADNLWENRRERGYLWRTNVFDFIEKVYSAWLGKGLVQSDIKVLDPKLYAQFYQELCARSKREGKGAKDRMLLKLKFPAEKDAALEGITDPRKRIGKEYLREKWRLEKQNSRRKIRLEKNS